jgi:hypothetical protein
MPMLPDVIEYAEDLILVAERMKLLVELNRTNHVTIENKILEPVHVTTAVPTVYGPLFAKQVMINIWEKPAQQTQDYWISAALARFAERAKSFKDKYQDFRKIGHEYQQWQQVGEEFMQLHIAYKNAVAASFFYATLLQRQFMMFGRFNGNGERTEKVLSNLFELAYVPFPGDPFYRRGLSVVAMDIMLAIRMRIMPVVMPHQNLVALFPPNCYEFTVAPYLVNPLVNVNIGFMPLPYDVFPNGGGLVPGSQYGNPEQQNMIPLQGYGSNFGQGAGSYPYLGQNQQAVRYGQQWPGNGEWNGQRGLIDRSQVPQNYYQDRYQYQGNQSNQGQQDLTGAYAPNQQMQQQIQPNNNTQRDAQQNAMSSGTNVPYSPNYGVNGNQNGAQGNQQFQQGQQGNQQLQQGNQQGVLQNNDLQQRREQLLKEINDIDRGNGGNGGNTNPSGVDLNNSGGGNSNSTPAVPRRQL